MADLHSRGDKTDIVQWLQVTSGESVYFASDYRAFRDAAEVTEPPVRAGDDDMLYIMYTSGTTGLPKGVVHTHNTCIWGCITIAASTYYLHDDRFLSPLPMFHVGALTPITLCVYRGVTAIVMRNFDPARAWQLVDEERITIGLAVPAMLNFMLQVPSLERFNFSQWRWCMTGAAPVPESLIEAYAKIGIEVHQIYGLTESCGPATLIDADHALTRIGSAGKAFYHTDVRIVRPDGSACATNEPGEVLVAGPHIMREYWNRPEASAETLVDGWLHTGDVARMDEDGFVYIEDRIKDMIISGGENVYPAEIENVLQTHPRHRRGGRNRPAERALGRIALRRGGAQGRLAQRSRRSGVLPRQARWLQAAQGRSIRGRCAAQPQRQDTEADAARTVPRTCPNVARSTARGAVKWSARHAPCAEAKPRPGAWRVASSGVVRRP